MNTEIVQKKPKSLAAASAEYLRIRELIDVLIDGESYSWDDLQQFFDVPMDMKGRTIFRRAVMAEGRLYSPMAHPNRGLGIIMGAGNTVADIVGDKQKRVEGAIEKVVVVAGIAEKYKDVPETDMQYIRQLRAVNQSILNHRKAQPVKRLKEPVKICDGSDMKV